MINFKCPHCSHPMKVPENAAGKKGACKSCGNAVRVPSPNTEIIEGVIEPPAMAPNNNLTPQVAIMNAPAPPPQQAVNVVVNNPAPRWSPIVAVFLSFFWPGLGQMYKGQVINGLAWMFFVVLGYICFIFPGVFLHVCCVFGAALGDPYKQK